MNHFPLPNNSEVARTFSQNLDVKILSGAKARPLVDPFYEFVGKSHRSRDEDTFFILMEGTTVYGVVRYCVEKNNSMLRSMNIHPEHRGKKMGLILLKSFEAYLEKNKITDIFCIPYAHLLKFYSQIGFVLFPEEKAPQFLQERLINYRATYTEKHFSLMRRQVEYLDI